MADVDLSVAVTSTGAPEAIQRLQALREGGVATAKSMRDLAAQSAQVARNVNTMTSAVAGTRQKFSEVDKVFTETGADAISLTRQLRELEAGYKSIAQNNIGASPLERLTAGGGAAVARQVQAMREAFNADPVRDLQAVEKQEQETRRQGIALLEQQAAAQRALVTAQGTRVTATQSVSRANEDLANQRAGINGVQQAKVQLTRANEDLARAEEQVAKASIQNRVNGRFAKEDAGYVVAQVLFGLSTSLWQLYAARIFGGVLSSATLPASGAYVPPPSVSSTRRRSRITTRTAMLSSHPSRTSSSPEQRSRPHRLSRAWVALPSPRRPRSIDPLRT